MRSFLSLVLIVLFSNYGMAQNPTSVDSVALMAEKPARFLSQYKLFKDLSSQNPSPGVFAYELITPLFSDYAEKYRFVYVPEGSSAVYEPREIFKFPVGSVLIKTFSMPHDLSDPDTDLRLIETRLLIHKKIGWVAFAYVWNEEQNDAVLKIAGARLKLPVVLKNGKSSSINYKVPNVNQCKGCHAINNVIVPIGPKGRNLDREIDHDDNRVGQLALWRDLGILTKLPENITGPIVVNWNDKSADIDARARSYLDVNCAHCHRRDGPASNSGLFLTLDETNKIAWGYKKRPVAAGRGSGDLKFDIAPGKPNQSILIYRMKSLDPGVMMPELGRSLLHAEAISMLSDWISQMR